MQATPKTVWFVAFCLINFNAMANNQMPVPEHGPSPELKKQIEEHNKRLSMERQVDAPADVSRPYAEYENASYILMSAENAFESYEVKRQIAMNLPDGVDFVIFRKNGVASANSIKSFFGQYMEPSRLHVIDVGGTNSSFWARDNLPVPVYMKDDSLGVVDAKYYYNFEPDKMIAQHFGATLLSHGYGYEGGNFIADNNGNCALISRSIPNSIFESYYGCSSVTKLNHVAGIGHIDERVKFISETDAITDTASYKPVLERLGFKVTMIPRADRPFETYVNSLILNGTVFVPIYGERNDQKALEVYRSFGLKAIGIRSNNLSNRGKGSIHCITMTYPQASLLDIKRMLDTYMGE